MRVKARKNVYKHHYCHKRAIFIEKYKQFNDASVNKQVCIIRYTMKCVLNACSDFALFKDPLFIMNVHLNICCIERDYRK